MKRASAVAVLWAAELLVGAGCGSSSNGASAPRPDAGGDAVADATGSDAGMDAPADARWRSFDVTAALTLTPPAGDVGGWTTFPRTTVFTLVWDASGGVAVSGAHGFFGAGHVALADAGAGYRTTDLAAAVPFADGCGGVGTISFDTAAFSLAGAGLTGTAAGKARYVTSGADTIEAPFAATLTGTADETPPALALASAWSTAPDGGVPSWSTLLTATSSVPTTDVDPLAPLVFGASEPLPSDTAASFASTPGADVVALDGVVVDPAAWAAAAFTPAGKALLYGQTYTLHPGLADFAGNAAAPLTFTTRAAPPLVPADGFESVTGTTFAGAGVLHGGPLMPLSGQTSLLLNTGFGGGFGFLPYDLGPSVAVQLAPVPGQTVVRFSFQLIAPDAVDAAAFDGVVRVGYPGGAVVESTDLGARQFTRTTLPSLGDVFLSPVRTVSVTLPAGGPSDDTTSEPVSFEIVGRTFACERPPSPTVLVLDDLRVE